MGNVPSNRRGAKPPAEVPSGIIGGSVQFWAILAFMVVALAAIIRGSPLVVMMGQPAPTPAAPVSITVPPLVGGTR